MMKFPYELSEDRLSLLSRKDRDRYEYEHSMYYSAELREQAEREFKMARTYAGRHYMQMINEDEEFKDLEQDEKREMIDELVKLDASATVQSIIELVLADYNLTDKQLADLKESAVEYIMTGGTVNEEPESLLEARGDDVGNDCTYWLKDLPGFAKFLVSLCGAGLTGAVGAMGTLFMAGYHKAAMEGFQKKMNRTVEKIDMGLNKKKSFFMQFVPKFLKKNREDGDQSQACFRSIIELIERDMAKNCIMAGIACGILSGDGMSDAISGNDSNGGLMTQFKPNIADKLAGLVEFEN